jgi:AcrR family transcriptional regulator
MSASGLPLPPPPAGVGRRERRKQEVRARIYEAAQALFVEKGFADTTVEQIAAAADVAPATFFNHFQSKQALLGLMTSEVVDYLQQLAQQHLERSDPARERLLGFATAAAELLAAHRGVARDVMLELMRTEARPDATAPYLARVHEPFETMLRQAQARGEVRAEPDAAFVAQMVVGMLNAAVTHWLADADYPVEARLVEAARFAWQAIRAHPGPDAGEE